MFIVRGLIQSLDYWSHTGPIPIYIKYKAIKHYHHFVPMPNGSKLSDIKEIFMKLFADVIPKGLKFSDFKFHLAHEGTQITNDYELKSYDLLVACSIHQNIGPIIPHPITPDVPYYMWSVVNQTNDGLMKRDENTNVIKCDGKKSDPSTLTQFTATTVTSGESDVAFAFTLPSSSPNKVYVMKGVGENQDLIAEEVDKSFVSPSMPDEYKFAYTESFSYTLYRCIGVGNPRRDDLYICVQQDGTVQLQKAGLLGYATPSSLFIAVNMI